MFVTLAYLKIIPSIYPSLKTTLNNVRSHSGSCSLHFPFAVLSGKTPTTSSLKAVFLLLVSSARGGHLVLWASQINLVLTILNRPYIIVICGAYVKNCSYIYSIPPWIRMHREGPWVPGFLSNTVWKALLMHKAEVQCFICSSVIAHCMTTYLFICMSASLIDTSPWKAENMFSFFCIPSSHTVPEI